MSVEKRGPIKMPQPEQWLSEHVWALPVIVAVAFVLGWLVSRV